MKGLVDFFSYVCVFVSGMLAPLVKLTAGQDSYREHPRYTYF